LSFILRQPGPGGARSVLATIATVVVLSLALALPASAHDEPTRLFDASASPRHATPTKAIKFKITYRNDDGHAPAYVRVLIDGAAHEMAADPGSRWQKGVVHRYSTTLDVGVHEVSFEAADVDDHHVTIDGGRVTIEAAPAPPTAAPTPRPTPDPTPDAKPAPTPRPTKAPTRTPDPTPRPTPRPRATPAPAMGGTKSGGSKPKPVDVGLVAAGPSTGNGTPPSVEPSDDPLGGDDGSNAGGAAGTDNRNDPGSGDGWGGLASAMEALGLGKTPPILPLIPTLIGTSGGVTMALAFAIFGKKRRDEEQPAPDEVLRAQASRGIGVASSGSLVGGGAAKPGQLVLDVVRNAAVPAVADAESTMPRWRRPSLLEARKADPNRTVVVPHNLSFSDSRVEPAAGYERRTIRYRVVRLLDAPDELLSAEIGQLDQGDEVQLLERSGAYWLVLCPDGRQGWLHKMTLGDVVNAVPSPTAAEAMGGAEIDADVLAAFMAARVRA
jgi:hypothetical protein